jgi:hypothetical protein
MCFVHNVGCQMRLQFVLAHPSWEADKKSQRWAPNEGPPRERREAGVGGNTAQGKASPQQARGLHTACDGVRMEEITVHASQVEADMHACRKHRMMTAGRHNQSGIVPTLNKGEGNASNPCM